MWGEHGGSLIPQLRQLIGLAYAYTERVRSNQVLANFVAQGPGTWVANMNPDISYFQAGCKALLDQSLGAAASDLGYNRWGFKEIRYGRIEALILQDLYPDASFILLVRDPVSCLKSIKGTPWYEKDFQSSPVKFLDEWARLSTELAELDSRLNCSYLVRYEDATSNPQAVTERIAEATQIPYTCFDQSVFEQVLRGSRQISVELDSQDVSALCSSKVSSTAALFRYEIQH
jgi:hypothetical protein